MKYKLLLYSAFLSVFADNCYAIVNMDNLHLGTIPSGTSGSFNLSSSGATGNREQFQISSGFELHNKQSASLQYLAFNYSYGESFSKEDQNKSYLHLRHIHNLERNHTWELFTQVEQNKFSRLNFRGLIGGGYRWNLTSPQSKNTSIFGVGAYYSEEYLTHSSVTNEERELQIARGNIYWVFRSKLFDTVSLFNTSYYQPSLRDFKDFRILEIAGLEMPLTKNLQFKIFGEGTIDSKPPIGVRKGDLSYKTGIEYKF